MQTVLVVSFTDLERDPRVNRQIRFVRDRYRVIAAGLADPRLPGVEFVPLVWSDGTAPAARLGRTPWEEFLFHAGRVRNIPRRVRRITNNVVGTARYFLGQPTQFERLYWSNLLVQDALRKLSRIPADVVVANDPDTWPLAIKLRRRWDNGARVVFDAHEYAPREYDNTLRFRLVGRPYKTYLCQTYIPLADELITISCDIAAYYQRDTGRRATVVTNAPDYEPGLAPRFLSAEPGRPIRLVHHGLAAPVRRLEHFVEMMEALPGAYEFTFMLMPSDPRYYAWLRRRAAGDPRVRFVPPVPMREIPSFLNAFDVGVQLIEPENFNHLHCLPNKFFEWIQARLAIAAGPARELGAMVREYDLGVVADDYTPTSMARRLVRVTRDQIDAYKLNAHRHARALSAAPNCDVLLGVIERALAREAQLVG